MQIRSDQLPAMLARQLQPAYLIAGAEPLLLQEAAAAVRAAARAKGYVEREVFDVLPGFDWNDFRNSAQSMGLFAQQRLLELRLPAKLDASGVEALRDYLARPDPHAILLLTLPDWSRTVQALAWVQDIDRLGALVPVWPVRAHELPRWLAARAQARGLRLSGDAVEHLAERVEGNLLAAAQEIDLLVLLAPPGKALDAAALQPLVGDSARFDVFQLADAMLGGDAARAVRVLRALHAEGSEPVPLFSWLLIQVEQLARLSVLVAQGTPPASACARMGVREWNQQPVLRALARGDAHAWQARLLEAAPLDLALKGRGPGAPWLLLERWILRCALPAAQVERFAA